MNLMRTQLPRSVFSCLSALALLAAGCDDESLDGEGGGGADVGGSGSGANGSGANGSGGSSSSSPQATTGTQSSTGSSTSSTGGSGPTTCANGVENLTANNGGGVTVQGFPACISFSTDAYDTDLGLVWLNPGATHEYDADGGWNGGGAARFTPPTPNQATTGLGQFHIATTPPSHLSMRWLMKAGPTMGQYAHGNKTIIFVQTVNDAAHPRPMIITRPNPAVPNAFVPAPCDGTVCRYHGAPANEPWFPDGSDTFWIGGTGGYQEQWVAWEFEADLTEGWIRLYLTTEDGVFNDTLYVENALIDEASITGGTFSYIDMVGGYFGDGIVSDPGNWFAIDELVISDRHIGPPPGLAQ